MRKHNELNLLFTGIDSVGGYQADVLNRIDERLKFHKCVITQIIHDDGDRYDAGKYVALNYDMCAHCRYGEYYDWNKLKALPGELVEAMIPYETNAMHMLQRRYNFDIMTYDEQRRYYLQHLQFWYHIFETQRINYVILTNVPHHTFDYIIYGLARIYGIRLCIFDVTVVRSRYFLCSHLENIQVEVAYHDREEETVLLPDLELYYQAKKYKTDVDVLQVELPRKAHIREQRENYFSDIKRMRNYRRFMSRAKQGLAEFLRTHDSALMKKNRAQIREEAVYMRRAYRKLRTMTSIDKYNKMTVRPDYSEKYIIFFLHMQPEASTLPMAGIFTDQLLVLKILSQALAGTGIRLYVKEHFVQPYREQYFYEDIKGLEGVRLINCFEDSRTLIRHSLAVSTCTGTVTLEAIINGKPALVFGTGMLSSAEGVHTVHNVSECREAVRRITAPGYGISQNRVRQFLKAFGEQTVMMYIYLNEVDSRDTMSVEESKRHLVDAVVNWYTE